MVEDIHDDTWYVNERGRYLCTSGRTYGNAVFTWKFQDVELDLTELTLPEGNNCDLTGGCFVACLKTLVSQIVPPDNPGPYHAVVKYSACTIASDKDTNDDSEYFDYNNEYYDYMSMLMFGEISTANEGNYTFNISGGVGSSPKGYDGSKGQIEVKKTVIDSNIRIIVGNLTNPDTLLLEDNQLLLIHCHGNHISMNTTPQWFKDDEPIEFVGNSTNFGCNNTALSMYYTVETSRLSSIDYPGDSEVSIYSSTASLYLCSITPESVGHYNCNMIIDANTIDHRSIEAMVPLTPPSSSGDISETQKLLIICFAVLNGILIVAILVTLVVWCWMKCSVSKDKQVHHAMNDIGLPAYLYSSLELETTFIQDGIDSMEFPFDQLEFLHLLGLYVELTVSVDVRHYYYIVWLVL